MARRQERSPLVRKTAAVIMVGGLVAVVVGAGAQDYIYRDSGIEGDGISRTRC